MSMMFCMTFEVAKLLFFFDLSTPKNRDGPSTLTSHLIGHNTLCKTVSGLTRESDFESLKNGMQSCTFLLGGFKFCYATCLVSSPKCDEHEGKNVSLYACMCYNLGIGMYCTLGLACNAQNAAQKHSSYKKYQRRPTKCYPV